MIQGFEIETAPLSEYERNILLPIIVSSLKNSSKQNPIKNKLYTRWLKAGGYEIEEARFRKIVSAIRRENLVPNLIASSKGYYVTNDPDEIDSYIQSLRSRARAINSLADALLAQSLDIQPTLF